MIWKKNFCTDSIVIETERVMDLLILAIDYKEEELKQKCLDIITKSITMENVCNLYCYSIRKNLNELENRCFEFAFNKLKKVTKTEAFKRMNENFAESFKIKVLSILAFSISSLVFFIELFISSSRVRVGSSTDSSPTPSSPRAGLPTGQFTDTRVHRPPVHRQPVHRHPVHRHPVHRYAGPPSPSSPTASPVTTEIKTTPIYLSSHST